MPAKNTSYKSGKRDLVISKDFYKNFIDETNIDISYLDFRNVILASNKAIADIIANGDDSFKLPEQMGYIAVTKYKSKKKSIDWKSTRLLGKKIILPNLHSFGYIHHIRWYKTTLVNFAFNKIFKLEPCRALKRQVAKNVKEGKEYSTWEISDFWSKSKTLKYLKG